jgi:NAD(P)-dependent dehydrogenase (short-subunit alcohol dehydrogenase family)
MDFTAADWASCLKVLEALSDDTAPATDRALFERLVARIYKKARKRRRREASQSATSNAETDDQHLATSSTGSAQQPLAVVGPGVAPLTDERRAAIGAPAKRCCYVCGRLLDKRHRRYAALCPPCGELNEEKRNQRTDLSGRRALVTGGRIKIGFQTALKFLRDGAAVTVTTRFARDAARRYAEQPDFDRWKDRLKIYRVDFRDLRGLLLFADHLAASPASLEILVNNAAQTVRRPQQGYSHYLAKETTPREACPAHIRNLLGEYRGQRPPALTGSSAQRAAIADQAMVMPENPRELVDEHGEPLDLQEHNSWTLRLDEVAPLELLEVLVINSAAPSLLIGRLKSLFKRSPFPDRYVVNVVGRDGQFDQPAKSPLHPHINMSKAALNMITRTSAGDYAEDGIYVNSVDTGWISHEVPYPQRIALEARGVLPPLDEIDGAARIYDPIVRGLRGDRVFGHLWRNYERATW